MNIFFFVSPPSVLPPHSHKSQNPISPPANLQSRNACSLPSYSSYSSSSVLPANPVLLLRFFFFPQLMFDGFDITISSIGKLAI
ncbi:hypothetical protein ACFX13_012825 [Malus domestica]